jgi:hypothetical protein
MQQEISLDCWVSSTAWTPISAVAALALWAILQALRRQADMAAVEAEEAVDPPPGLLRYSVTVAAGGGGRKGAQ